MLFPVFSVKSFVLPVCKDKSLYNIVRFFSSCYLIYFLLFITIFLCIFVNISHTIHFFSPILSGDKKQAESLLKDF